MTTPRLTQEAMQFFMLHLRLWQYGLSDAQLQEVGNSLQLLCADAIKVYKANKSAQNPHNSVKLSLAARINPITQ